MEAQIAEVGPWIQAGPDLERDGVTRWRVQDIVRKIREAFGVIYTESGARMMLRRAGFHFAVKILWDLAQHFPRDAGVLLRGRRVFAAHDAPLADRDR